MSKSSTICQCIIIFLVFFLYKSVLIHVSSVPPTKKRQAKIFRHQFETHMLFIKCKSYKYCYQ